MPNLLTKPLNRKVHVLALHNPVVITITPTEIQYRVPGTKTHVTITHDEAVSHARTPTNVPSFLYGNGMALMRYEEDKKRKKSANG